MEFVAMRDGGPSGTKKKRPKLPIPTFPTAEHTTGTVAENCSVFGEGLTVATCGQFAAFTIEARDANGVRMRTGGDSFFVYVRGPSRVRAEVTDNSDGTYSVQWRVCYPTLSSARVGRTRF